MLGIECRGGFFPDQRIMHERREPELDCDGR